MVAVVANRAEAAGLQFAAAHGIATRYRDSGRPLLTSIERRVAREMTVTNAR